MKLELIARIGMLLFMCVVLSIDISQHNSSVGGIIGLIAILFATIAIAIQLTLYIVRGK